MEKINNLHLFVASTIRLNKKNQDGLLYLVDIAYRLKMIVMRYEDDQEYQEKSYQLCLSLVRHKEKIQASKLEEGELTKRLSELSVTYPRWTTRKYKSAKSSKMYWKKLYKRKLETQKKFLELYFKEFEAAFPNYLITFNELLERVKNVCVFE